MERKRIGFIGLGIMGKPMAKNLVRAGYPLTVYNRSRPSIDELVEFGARAVGSSKEVAERSDVVITMLPDSPDVQQVVLGRSGVLEGARPGSVIIDMSSIAPLVAQDIARRAKEKGVRMLDAPVSGGEEAAVQGTLSIMVGGDEETFNECLDILKVMGENVVHVGEVGAGNFTKLANQIIVAVTLEAVSEALVLGTKAGVDPEKMVNAIKGGAARCWALEVRAPNNMLVRNFKPGFKARLHYKDLNNILATGRDLGVPLPVTSLVHELFGALLVDGQGENDHSAILTVLERMAKVEVKKM
ncbi:MAG: 2-hydroxy-3-oxopropionate reductase [bacterium]